MSIVSLEELQARTAFVRAIAQEARVYAVEGRDGLARVKSPRRAEATIQLLWSDRAEAQRWSDALVKEPRVVSIDLSGLLSRHLPQLTAAELLVGGDWSDRPLEPEFTANDLDQRIRRRLIEQLAETAIKTRQVWLLKNGETPATLLTRHPAGGEVLPIFEDRAQAERAMEGAWAQSTPVRVPLGDFLQKILVWCVESRRRVAPAYVPGPGLIEMPAWDMKALMSGNAPTRRVA